MPQIAIQNIGNKTIQFNDTSKTVLTVLQENYIDWMHACGGKGRCTTCKMIVLEGNENFSAPSTFEQKMKKLERLKDNERLACQCTVLSDAVIRVPKENKLPHITYTD